VDGRGTVAVGPSCTFSAATSETLPRELWPVRRLRPSLGVSATFFMVSGISVADSRLRWWTVPVPKPVSLATLLMPNPLASLPLPAKGLGIRCQSRLAISFESGLVAAVEDVTNGTEGYLLPSPRYPTLSSGFFRI
jgi:hypothetical protein